MDATAIGLLVLAVAMTLYQIVIVWAAFNGKLMLWTEMDKAAVRTSKQPEASTVVAVLQPEPVPAEKCETVRQGLSQRQLRGV